MSDSSYDDSEMSKMEQGGDDEKENTKPSKRTYILGAVGGASGETSSDIEFHLYLISIIIPGAKIPLIVNCEMKSYFRFSPCTCFHLS